VTTMSMRSGPSPAQRQYRAVYEPIQFTRIIHIITYLPNASTITTTMKEEDRDVAKSTGNKDTWFLLFPGQLQNAPY